MKAITYRRVLSAALALIFVLSAYMAGTLAWASIDQEALNEARGSHSHIPARLIKYEKLPDGTVTQTPVSGAEFYLYMSDGTQVNGRFATDSDGKIELSLAPGNYYFEETNPSRNYTYDKDSAGDDIKRYPFTVSENSAQTVLVEAYNIHVSGSLVIEKTVRNEDDSPLTQTQRDTEFTFIVTFSDGGTYEYAIDNGVRQTLASGGTLKLKHGEKAVFDRVPAGVSYTVTEAPSSGYDTVSRGHQETITAQGSLALFTNTARLGSLTLTKLATGAKADMTKDFVFNVTIGNVTETVTLKPGQSKTYDKLPIGTPYAVTEADYSAEGYVTTPQSGFSGLTKGGNQTLTFVNAHDGGGSLPGGLLVTKTVTGAGGDLNKKFHFTVTFSDLPGAPATILLGGIATELSGVSSQFSFDLRHGETMLIENLPAGVRYTVTEAPDGDYKPSVQMGGGTVASNEAGGVITSGDTNEIGFVNEKTAPEDVKLIVQKIVDGKVPDADKNLAFHFVLELEGQAPVLFDLTAGQTQSFTIPKGARYTVREINLSGDYALIHTEYGSGSASVDVKAIFTNRYDGPWNIEVGGEKTWETGGAAVSLPESITIYLKDGNKIVAAKTVKPDENGRWTYNFTGLPKLDAQGREIAYSIEEAQIHGWKPAYTGNDIKNTYLTPTVSDSVTVEKLVNGDTPDKAEEFKFTLTAIDGAPLPQGSAKGQKTLTISGAGTAFFGSISYTDPGTYVYTVAEIDEGKPGYTYDTGVYTYTVVVAEQGGALTVVSRSLTKNGLTADRALFTNVYTPGKINVSVRKVWAGGGAYPSSVTAQLYRDGAAYGNAVLLNASNNWTYLWSGLEKEHSYTVDEPNVPAGFTRTISGDVVNGFVITNTKDGGGEKTRVSVNKTWIDGENPKRPGVVSVQLYQDGKAYGTPITLSEANKWKYTWTELETGHSYAVDEPSVPEGYVKTVTGSAATGFTITNTKGQTPPPGQILISGKKTWDHGSNPEKERPSSIVLYIKADGVIILQKQIGEAEHWSWSVRVDKYASDGHEIVYTVDEQSVAAYKKTVDGFNILNTYSPGSPGGPGGPGGGVNPKTYDDSNIYLWIILMLVSLGALIALAFGRKRRLKKANFEYKPKH